MNLDIRIISALIGALAVILSALLSYIISKRTKDRENAIAYLKRKIRALEDEKYILVEMKYNPIEEKFTKENFMDKYDQSLSDQFNKGAKSFRHIDHYLSSSSVKSLNDQIKKLNLALGTTKFENIAGRKLPTGWAGDIPREDALRYEIITFLGGVIQVIDDELKKSIINLERLSEL